MVTFENVTKKFGQKTIMQERSFRFEKTGLLAVAGKSGCGKTTFLRMIAGLDRQYEGRITVDGDVAVSFQEYRLFPQLSALDNLVKVVEKKPTDAFYESARAILTTLGFSSDEMKLYPHQLSGGMKQRVNVARALLSDAPILLLDEPFKELDPVLRGVVSQLLAEASRSRLVILTVHASEEADRLGAILFPIGD